MRGEISDPSKLDLTTAQVLLNELQIFYLDDIVRNELLPTWCFLFKFARFSYISECDDASAEISTSGTV
jgi:hypothetical protein